MNKRKVDRSKRLVAMIVMRLFRGGWSRANFLKKIHIFGKCGENLYWFPRKLPAEPSQLFLHNNVNIGTEVYFCDHDE